MRFINLLTINYINFYNHYLIYITLFILNIKRFLIISSNQCKAQAEAERVACGK